MRQVADEQLRLLALDRLLKCLEHRLLDCTTAHRAQRAAVLAQEQARTGLLRRRPRNTDYRSKGASLTAREQLEHGLNDVSHALHLVPIAQVRRVRPLDADETQ